MALDPRWASIPLSLKLARWRVHRASSAARAARRELEAAMKATPPAVFELPIDDREAALYDAQDALGCAALECAALEHEAASVRRTARCWPTTVELERWVRAAADKVTTLEKR